MHVDDFKVSVDAHEKYHGAFELAQKIESIEYRMKRANQDHQFESKFIADLGISEDEDGEDGTNIDRLKKELKVLVKHLEDTLRRLEQLRSNKLK